MRTQFNIRQHSVTGAPLIEVLYDGEFIATVCEAEGPALHVVSKYPITAVGAEGLEMRTDDGRILNDFLVAFAVGAPPPPSAPAPADKTPPPPPS